MADSKGVSSGLGVNTGGGGITAKITSTAIFAAMILAFLVIVLFFFLYLCSLFYLRPRTTARSRTNFMYFPRESPVLSRGLNPAVLRSLPVMVYRPSDFHEGLECAVCISEIAEGEEARLLPKCNHGFHLECIDMWFHSHSTCPLCRCPVIQELSACESSSLAADDEAGHDVAGSHIPENVQHMGNEEQANNGSLGSERVLVISIPLRTPERMFASFTSPLQSNRGSVQDRKSPVEEARSPAASRLGSIKRLLSRGKKNGGSCSNSPRIGDMEQGMVGSVPSN